jgi:hypothetical protein
MSLVSGGGVLAEAPQEDLKTTFRSGWGSADVDFGASRHGPQAATRTRSVRMVVDAVKAG